MPSSRSRAAIAYSKYDVVVEDIDGHGDCESPDPADTVTDRLNGLLSAGGPGYRLRLCPGKQYMLQSPLRFAAREQEVSTYGYPTDDSRATLVVNGPVDNDSPHTVAVDGACSDCDGIKLLNVQVDGDRGHGSKIKTGGANIEFGGDNQNQLIEHVRCRDPRGWSCIHIAEGPLTCSNATVQHNQVGPCGTDEQDSWADGISLSCANSVVRSNLVGGATDGGIVIFGAPGTVVEDNIIWPEKHILLGGINMVDYLPWDGNYTGVRVQRNIILGGYATDAPVRPMQKYGSSPDRAITKIGIAIGPRTWFGDKYGSNVTDGGDVLGNRLSGAFGYGIALTSARNTRVENNTLFGNVSFIGARGPTCGDDENTPFAAAFIIDRNNTDNVLVQSDFQDVPDADAVVCVVPPKGGDYWPFRSSADASPVAILQAEAALETATSYAIITNVTVTSTSLSGPSLLYPFPRTDSMTFPLSDLDIAGPVTGVTLSIIFGFLVMSLLRSRVKPYATQPCLS